MKTNIYLFIVLAAALLALVGCGKSGQSKPATVPPGVIDIGSLQQAFPAPTPEVMNSLNKIRFAARYRQFTPAFAELNKLSRLPNLTDQQKNAISNVIEQVKIASTTGPTPPPR